MTTLIVGGTSGLGFELAQQMHEAGDDVIVAGRRETDEEGIESRTIDLNTIELGQRIGKFVVALPNIDTLVYAPGFYQEGHVDELFDNDIKAMNRVCYEGLIYFVREILKKQDELPELVTITSTSARFPQELEPVYNGAKAGAAHFSNGVSKDPRLGKVLVVAPGGMDTGFWEGTGKDTSQMLDPAWVAEEIMRQREGHFEYKHTTIFRGDPPKVEVSEDRKS